MRSPSRSRLSGVILQTALLATFAGCASSPDADTVDRHVVDGIASKSDRQAISTSNERILGAERANDPDAAAISSGTQGLP